MHRMVTAVLLVLLPLPSIAAMQGAGTRMPGGERLPDSVVIAGRNADISYLSASLALRYAVSAQLDLEFGAYLYNYSRYDTTQQDYDDSGTGDARFGVRYTLPRDAGEPWISFRGGITLPIGDDGFSVNDETADLGARVTWPVFGNQSLGFGGSASVSDAWQSSYVNLSWTLSTDSISPYLEAGAYGGDAGGTIAGGGMEFHPGDRISVDIHALAGVDSDAPDIQAGISLLVIFD